MSVQISTALRGHKRANHAGTSNAVTFAKCSARSCYFFHPPLSSLIHKATSHGALICGHQATAHVAPLVRDIIAQLVLERPGLGIQAPQIAAEKHQNWSLIFHQVFFGKKPSFQDHMYASICLVSFVYCTFMYFHVFSCIFMYCQYFAVNAILEASGFRQESSRWFCGCISTIGEASVYVGDACVVDEHLPKVDKYLETFCGFFQQAYAKVTPYDTACYAIKCHKKLRLKYTIILQVQHRTIIQESRSRWYMKLKSAQEEEFLYCIYFRMVKVTYPYLQRLIAPMPMTL